jgi:type IV pilus assembly protein PilW
MRERRSACGASSMRGRGHSLIELLIATGLGVLLVGVAALLYRAQREAVTLSADAASIRDAGMTALLVLGQQIEMAGFAPTAGRGNDDDHLDRIVIAPAVFGCDSGMPSSDDDPPACRPVPGASDAVVVRYVDDGVATWRTAAGQATDCLGQGVGMPGEHVDIVNRFYVGLSGTGETQLYCDGNGGGKQPVVAGIERLSARYWMRGAIAPVGARSVEADAWSDVVAVDLCVLVRGARPVSQHRYIDCDGVLVTSTDGRARQTFSRRVAVRNNEARGQQG